MMIERIKEENVWDFLKNDNKPIMIYGMGNGAEKIISTLDTYGVKVSEIFASDEFVRGHSFLGYKVLKYSDICEKYDDFNVVLAFATHLENVIENIKKINNEHKVFAPDVPVCGGILSVGYKLRHQRHRLLDPAARPDHGSEAAGEERRLCPDLRQHRHVCHHGGLAAHYPGAGKYAPGLVSRGLRPVPALPGFPVLPPFRRPGKPCHCAEG